MCANASEIHRMASAEAAFAVKGELTMTLHFGCVHLHREE